MRPRSQTSSCTLQPSRQMLLVKQQCQRQRLQLSLQTQRYKQLQKQRDILKQGNMHLIEKFLLDKQKEQMNRYSSEIIELEKQNTELNKLIEEVRRILKQMVDQSRDIKNEQGQKQFNSSRFSIKMEEQRNIIAYIESPIGFELNKLLKQVVSYFNQFKETKSKLSERSIRLQEENNNLVEEIQVLRNTLEEINRETQQVKQTKMLSATKSTQKNMNVRQKENNWAKKHQVNENQRIIHQMKENQERLLLSIEQLTAENTYLQQKLYYLTTEITQMKQQRKQQKEMTQAKQVKQHPKQARQQLNTLTHPAAPMTKHKTFSLNDPTIPMTLSQCQTQSLYKSIIYQQLSQSAIMRASIATESYDKKLNRLQKVNLQLERDYSACREKIKQLNREYSRLKLDYLKVDDEKKREVDVYEREIDGLKKRVDGLNRKVKEQQLIIERVHKQREKQKLGMKEKTTLVQSRVIQLQQLLQKKQLQNQELQQQLLQQQSKHKLQISKHRLQILQQIESYSRGQLQKERQRNQQLNRQLQRKSQQFEKSLHQYQQIIEDMRRVNGWSGVGDSRQQRNKEIPALLIKSGRGGTGDSCSINRDALISRLVRQKQKQKQSLQARNRSKQSRLSMSRQFPISDNHCLIKQLKQQTSTLQCSLQTETQRYNILQNSNKQLRLRLIKMIDNQQTLRKQLLNQRVKSRTKSISQKYTRALSTKRLAVMEGSGVDNNKGSQRFSVEGEDINGVDEVMGSMGKQGYRMATQRSSQYPTNKPLYQSSSSRELNSHSMITTLSNKRGGCLKTLRERRFDPKETLVSKPLKDNILISTHQLLSRSESAVNSLSKPSEHKQINKHSPINRQQPQQSQSKQLQSLRQNYEEPTNEDIKTTTRNSVNDSNIPSPKYTYQPPNSKRSISKSPSPIPPKHSSPFSRSPHNTLSNYYNQQITLQISQSQSNLSRKDMVIQLGSNHSQLIQDSPFVNPFGQITAQKTHAVMEEPATVGKFNSQKNDQDSPGKQAKQNIVMNGKDQATRSTVEVRFVRKC